LLERYGCVVETAHDGGEALCMVRNMVLQGNYDVIIADIRLPDMSGYELLIKLQETMDPAPLVLMTGFGYDPGHSIVKARQAGLQSYAVLYKPFRLDQLLETVERVIHAPEPFRSIKSRSLGHGSRAIPPGRVRFAGTRHPVGWPDKPLPRRRTSAPNRQSPQRCFARLSARDSHRHRLVAVSRRALGNSQPDGATKPGACLLLRGRLLDAGLGTCAGLDPQRLERSGAQALRRLESRTVDIAEQLGRRPVSGFRASLLAACLAIRS